MRVANCKFTVENRQCAGRSTRRIEASFFDRLIEKQGRFDPFSPQGWQTLESHFVACVRQQDAELLDIGCGTGASRQIYRNHVRRYVGIDLCARAVRQARREHPDTSWMVADATSLPFAEACFDVVAFSSVLHHVPDFAVALEEAFRVLRPGGVVFSFDPNLWHPAMALLRHPQSPLYQSHGVSPNERPLTERQLRKAFLSAGFPAPCVEAHSGIGYRELPVRSLAPFVRWFNSVDLLVERVGLGRAFGTFLIGSARKPGRPT